jgi:hypothetical protein
MDGKSLRLGTTLCQEFSSDSKWIWNYNLENFYELIFNRNLLEILGTLDFNEIWPASSLLHLIARKNQFPSKEYQKFEFHSKREIRLISRQFES